MTSDGGNRADGEARVAVSGPLSPAEAAEVLDLVREAADADGVGPLSEHVMLHLRYGGEAASRDVLVWYQGRLAGYGHLEGASEAEGPAGELVVRPAARRHGLARALGRVLVAEAGGRSVRLWAHGDLPAATELAASAGFRRSRALWQMRRSLRRPVEEPELPPGVSVRTFQVGKDEDGWLAVNSRAFARHPEQGAWARRDIDMREREGWFDPDGFFLAERHGKLVGFHWTKVHSGPDVAEQAPIGEVYVVGVDPDEQGSGLGRALTLIGMRYLRDRGLSQVMLYVDETNTAAIRMYESLGFTHRGTDVMFSGGAASGRNGPDCRR